MVVTTARFNLEGLGQIGYLARRSRDEGVDDGESHPAATMDQTKDSPARIRCPLGWNPYCV
jgi:hypothetical protein